MDATDREALLQRLQEQNAAARAELDRKQEAREADPGKMHEWMMDDAREPQGSAPVQKFPLYGTEPFLGRFLSEGA